MKRFIWKSGLIFCLALFSLTQPEATARERKWFVSFYGGQFNDGDLAEIVVFRNKFKHAYIAALAVGRELWRSENDALGFEVEGQIVKNWGYEIHEDDDPASGDPGWDWAPGMSHDSMNSGWSTHEEFNLAAVLRWHRFPWDRYLDTQFAAGGGLSYATILPPCETDPHGQLHGPKNERFDVARLLHYLLFEFAFTHPRIAPYDIFLRIHHRSGIFGLVNGVDGGSNFVCGGIRYHFE